ncbi:MAG TPA: hypothetical protein VMC62_02585 [Longilinea sp.]|nr:hypothetical protein [Longilinea sp.]
MGAFNTVMSEQKCSNCGIVSEFAVQFKYGEVWQHEYVLGDRIIWGKGNIGNQEYKKVVVDGVGEPCPNCHTSGQDFEVWIEE